VFRNVDTRNSDAGESPQRKNTTFTTRRQFEIKYNVISYMYSFMPTVSFLFLQAGSSVCASFSFFFLLFVQSDHLHTSSLLGISSLTSFQNVRNGLIFEFELLLEQGSRNPFTENCRSRHYNWYYYYYDYHHHHHLII
jgi:hypothetical protein